MKYQATQYSDFAVSDNKENPALPAASNVQPDNQGSNSSLTNNQQTPQTKTTETPISSNQSASSSPADQASKISSSEAITRQFALFLQQEISLVDRVAEILPQEKMAIEQNDLPILEQLTQTKHAVLLELQQHAKSRLEWMVSQQLPTTKHCLSTEPVASCGECCELWQELAEKYDNNSHQSAILSDAVATLNRRIRIKLQVLRDQLSDAATYNQQGEAASNGQSLGSIKV